MHSAKSFASTLLGFSLLLLFTLLLTVAWNVQAGQDDAEGDGTSAEITKSSDREPVENGNGGNEATGRSDFPPIFNTQEIGDTPLLPPEEALATIQVPDGFQVELFAAEPDVQQPIAMATDGRGRLWVAENYTYAESGVNFDSRLRDRIVILEDSTGDGKADRRTVFWDQAEKLTSIEIGFGGVWALCAPHLLFIPDADGDDQPDGEPIVVLDGWDENAVRHNIVNGLRWGPDGWLYGRHGILATSRVAAPGPRSSPHFHQLRNLALPSHSGNLRNRGSRDDQPLGHGLGRTWPDVFHQHRHRTSLARYSRRPLPADVW
jgi:hypothetical protein